VKKLLSLSPEAVERLEALAERAGKTQSELVERWIETAARRQRTR
jgi:predicted DNA-binding protein